MANYCDNMVVITAKTVAARAFAPRIVEAIAQKGDWLDVVLPPPAVLVAETERGWLDVQDAEIRTQLREAAEKRNTEQYGYPDLRQWCWGNWGTPWMADAVATINQSDGKFEITSFFTSAWEPPILAYEALNRLGFEIYAEYAEFGLSLGGIVQLYRGRKAHKSSIQTTSDLSNPKDPIRLALEANGWSISEWYNPEDEDE